MRANERFVVRCTVPRQIHVALFVYIETAQRIVSGPRSLSRRDLSGIENVHVQYTFASVRLASVQRVACIRCAAKLASFRPLPSEISQALVTERGLGLFARWPFAFSAE